MDRFFETNYVLIRNDSRLSSLAFAVRFDNSSVHVAREAEIVGVYH